MTSIYYSKIKITSEKLDIFGEHVILIVFVKLAKSGFVRTQTLLTLSTSNGNTVLVGNLTKK